MTDPQVWLTILGSLGALIVLGASAVALFKANLATATINNLQSNNKAQAERIDLLEEQAARDALDKEKQEVRLNSLERENQILRDALSGKADIERMVSVLDHHHQTITNSQSDFLEEWRREVDSIKSGVKNIEGILGARYGDGKGR